ncbi:MAG: cell division protein FtsZ [Chitinophagaceae bacterium]|nr:cell division protein FtsZ [Chitinophagaceae bacterium]
MIHFEIPKNQSSIIKVIGVGGGGSNAVNHMYNLGVEGVDFLICNTDSQALELSPIPNKIQLGPHLTQGLGAGANPEIGKQASEESLDDITKILKVNTRMAFITAGMGGGTGTGGAPVVAKICKDLDILTVGIVSTPFSYEGKKRKAQADEGINKLKEHVDTILIISNDKLRQQCGNMPFRQAFAKADDILATAAKCITDVITTTGQINVDFADVCTVMKNGGRAILGSAAASGENRAHVAVEDALNSPLLDDSDISGAKWILLNINSAEGEHEHTMDEAETIQAYVQEKAGEDCDVILGMGNDATLEDKISVTVIATGFDYKTANAKKQAQKVEDHKIVINLDASGKLTNNVTTEAPITTDPFAPVIKENANTQEDVVNKIVTNVWERNHAILNDKKEETNPPIASTQAPTESASFSVTQRPMEATIMERIISPQEQEERERFEEQKRQLEERAERLRNLSFNVKTNEPLDATDIENVPAYLRNDKNLENTASSSEKFYSGYTVGMKHDAEDKSQATIGTINTFLDGNKPD